MNYTITWQIIDLYREVPSGYVYKAKFKVSAFCPKSQKTIAMQDQALLDLPEELIPFENLSEELLVQWVKAASDQALIEDRLCSKLNLIAEPQIKQGLPWESDEIYAETLPKNAS